MGKIIKRKIRSHDASGELREALFKPIEEKDIQTIIAIARESFDKVWSHDEFRYFVAHSSGFCLGVWVDHNLSGYFLGLLVQGELDIVSIAIAKPWRRLGLAEILLRLISEDTRVRRQFLEVESDNEAAILLYRKCGFLQYGIRKKYYAGKKDALLMRKEKS